MIAIFDIFKKYSPIKEVFDGDSIALFLNLFGTILIALTFLIIGCICLLAASKSVKGPAHEKRKKLTHLFGAFLVSCGISKGIDIYCIWYHYAIINALGKIFTGTIAALAIFYIPTVLRAIKNATTFDELNKNIEETKTKIDTIKELSEKVIQR